MAEFLNPAHHLEDLAHVFEDGAQIKGGINIDEDLCRFFAEGLRETAIGVEQLVEFARTYGLVHTVEVERDRTPVERQRLARRAAPLDPDGRVLSFPQEQPRRVAITGGGSAA